MSNQTELQKINCIKSYIANNQPVACHAGSAGDEHWVTAYSYTDGNTLDDILVLDPAGVYGASSGATRTLREGMVHSGVTTNIDKIRVRTLL